MKPLTPMSECTPQKLEEARLHIETEMVRRGASGSDPPGDRLDTVSDMLLILVDKYRNMGRLLVVSLILLFLALGGLVHMTIGYLKIQENMAQLQRDQETLIIQQRETRKAVSETRDKLDQTSQTVTETKQAVEKAAEPAPSSSASKPRLRR